MSQAIRRSPELNSSTVTFSPSVGVCTPIPMATASGFAVHVPTGGPGGTVNWYASYSIDGPFLPVVMSNGNYATTAMSPGVVYIAPPELFPCYYIKGVATSTFTATIMMKG